MFMRLRVNTLRRRVVKSSESMLLSFAECLSQMQWTTKGALLNCMDRSEHHYTEIHHKKNMVESVEAYD